MTFRLSPEAETDVQSIARYIAVENPLSARRWIEAMYRHFQTLGAMPGIGVARADIRADLRMFVAGPYLILYRQVGRGADIISVIHGARQWQDLL